MNLATTLIRETEMSHKLSRYLVIVALAACGDSSTDNSDSLIQGNAIDAAGDNLAEASPATDPDIVVVHMEIENGQVYAYADFAPGSLDASTGITFVLDLDQDAATGYQGGGYGTIGPEFIISLGPDQGVSLYRWNGATFVNIPTGGSTTRTATRLETAIPLSVLNDGPGHLNFKTAVDVYLGGGSFSGVLDRAPEFVAFPVKVE